MNNKSNNRYLIVSRASGNRVEVEYDDRGLLESIRFESRPELTALDALLSKVPRNENEVTGWYPAQFEVTLIPLDVKFDVFWEAYGKKVGRQNAAAQWQKLGMNDRAKAIRSIPRYFRYCQLQNPPRQIVDPERYLKYRRFDDDFKI